MQDRSAEVREVVAASNDAFVEAVRRRDADAVATAYTIDAVVSPADAPDIIGREAVRELWLDIFGNGVDRASVETKEVHVDAAMAVEVGVLTADIGERRAFVERFHAVWLETSDGWRIHRQIWNIDA